MDTETVLFIDYCKRKIMEGDILLEERMRSDKEIEIAKRQPIENFFARRPALAACQNGDANSSGFRERRDRCEMLTRQNLGRRHNGSLPTRLDNARRGCEGNHRFSGSDVALQQAQHSLWQGEISGDVFERFLLRVRERIRQGFEYARAQAAFTGAAATGLAAHMGADKGERELSGQQLVVRKPRPGRVLRKNVRGLAWPVKVSQGRIEIGEFLACDPRLVLPLGHTRKAGQRTVHRAAD